MSCYPFLGMLSGVMQHLQYYCLHWLFRTRGTLSCDVTPVLALTRFTQTHVTFFCYPFLPLLGVLSVVKATLRLLPLVIPYSGTLRYDMTLVLALLFVYINACQCCYPFLLPLLGLRSGVMASLRYLHWSVRTRRSLRYAMSVILALVLLHK